MSPYSSVTFGFKEQKEGVVYVAAKESGVSENILIYISGDHADDKDTQDNTSGQKEFEAAPFMPVGGQMFDVTDSATYDDIQNTGGNVASGTIKTTDALGNQTAYSYDAVGRLLEEIRYGKTTDEETAYERTQNGEVQSEEALSGAVQSAETPYQETPIQKNMFTYS